MNLALFILQNNIEQSIRMQIGRICTSCQLFCSPVRSLSLKGSSISESRERAALSHSGFLYLMENTNMRHFYNVYPSSPLLSVSVTKPHKPYVEPHFFSSVCRSQTSESENVNTLESCFRVELEVVILIESDIDIFHVYYCKAACFKTINCIKCYINKHDMT